MIGIYICKFTKEALGSFVVRQACSFFGCKCADIDGFAVHLYSGAPSTVPFAVAKSSVNTLETGTRCARIPSILRSVASAQIRSSVIQSVVIAMVNFNPFINGKNQSMHQKSLLSAWMDSVKTTLITLSAPAMLKNIGSIFNVNSGPFTLSQRYLHASKTHRPEHRNVIHGVHSIGSQTVEVCGNASC